MKYLFLIVVAILISACGTDTTTYINRNVTVVEYVDCNVTVPVIVVEYVDREVVVEVYQDYVSTIKLLDLDIVVTCLSGFCSAKSGIITRQLVYGTNPDISNGELPTCQKVFVPFAGVQANHACSLYVKPCLSDVSNDCQYID